MPDGFVPVAALTRCPASAQRMRRLVEARGASRATRLRGFPVPIRFERLSGAAAVAAGAWGFGAGRPPTHGACRVVDAARVAE